MIQDREMARMNSDEKRQIYPYQGVEDEDDRMVINGVVETYARPRQELFWDRYVRIER